jgi:hypothetical protein
MAALFCLGLLLYHVAVFRGRRRSQSNLARLMWFMYLGLGCSGMVLAATDVLAPVFPPNYASALFLLLCVLISISGFLAFRAQDVRHAIEALRGQGLIETVLIVSQAYAIVFFLPFAIDSLVGDARENRLDLANKMEILGTYGLFNTLAGAASQLFGASLVMACVRLAQPEGHRGNMLRAVLLILASLSYVIYILAYVGRDGVVYWLMTALAVFLVFRTHMPATLRRQLVMLGATIGTVMMLPFIAITAARFVDSNHGTAWSILDYFGSQIHNFSDYSSIDRPLTLGIMNFPMFMGAACSVTVGVGCENWEDLKPFIFDQYLAQGKEPWLFATYVSDFVGDFGNLGTLVLLSIFALVCHAACRTQGGRYPMTIARLLLVLLCFLGPYWGIFYFRFSITNGFIVMNLAFILGMSLLQRLAPARRGLRRSNAGVNSATPVHVAAADDRTLLNADASST